MRRILTGVLICEALALAGICPALAGAATAPASAAPVFGYLDPKTNIFTPAPEPSYLSQLVLRPPKPPVVVTGTLNVTVTVTYSAFPVPRVTQASVSMATIAGQSAYPAYSSGTGGVATLVFSGNTGVATITVPYALNVSSTSDLVELGLYLFDSNGENVTLSRTVSLPANGATSNVSFTQVF